MSDTKAQRLERLKQEQARLQELLFLIDQQRRPRLHKLLSSVRAEIAALESQERIPERVAADAAPDPQNSLPELRQRQSELEETLFNEPPERRGPVKRLLAQVREAIDAAAERLSSTEKPATEETSSKPEPSAPDGPSRAA